MHCIKKHKLMPKVEMEVVRVYNKMHASFRVKMDWGIGGLKCTCKEG